MGRVLISLVLLFVTVSTGWSITEARLIGVSQGKRTALFNIGVHDEVREGDFAVVVKQRKDLSGRDLALIPIARARNVKVSTGNSTWILFKVFEPDYLVPGAPFLVLTESHLLKGRRDPRVGKLTIVDETEKLPGAVRRTLDEDRDRLSKLNHLYPELEILHREEAKGDSDLTLIEVESWKKFQDDRYRTKIFKGPNQEEFKRELRLSTFEKLVTAYLKKVNEPGFNYDAFYDEQMKENFANEFRKRSNFTTEYEAHMSDLSRRAKENAKLNRLLLEKGERWSENYSDEELSAVLGEVSVLQEKDRRKFLQVEPKRFATFFNLGWNLNDTQTDRDQSYRREGMHSLELELEGTPFVKHETLERFTLTGSMRYNLTALEAQSRNARVDEISSALGVNWYPLYAPHTQDAPVLFFGTYFRVGTAGVESPANGEKANYLVLSVPGLRAGLRYNLKSNLGLRLALSMEKIHLDRYEQNRVDTVLPSNADLVEGKMNFALAYLF